MAEEKTCQCSVKNPQRRTVLGWLWGLLSFLACIEIGWLGTSVLKSRKKGGDVQGGSTFIDGGHIDFFEPGTVKAVPEGMLYLCQLEDESFIALSRNCTHLGCTVPWDVKEQKFVCPCHGSTFDLKGLVLTSPAIRPLDYYPVRIENGRLRIDISRPLKRQGFDGSQTTRI